MKHTMLYAVTLAVALSGCASGPHVGLSDYAQDAIYNRKCVGPNAPYTVRDRECRDMWQPHTQTGQVQRITPPERMEQWQRDIHERRQCRATGEGCPQGLK